MRLLLLVLISAAAYAATPHWQRTAAPPEDEQRIAAVVFIVSLPLDQAEQGGGEKESDTSEAELVRSRPPDARKAAGRTRSGRAAPPLGSSSVQGDKIEDVAPGGSPQACMH